MALDTGILTFYKLNNDYLDSFGLGPTLSPTGSPTFNSSTPKVGSHSLNVGGHAGTGGTACALFNGGTVFDMSTGSRTITGWFYADNYTSSPGIVSNWANGVGAVVQWLFWHDSGAWKFQIRDTSNVDHVITSAVTPITGAYVFFALTYDSGTGNFALRINNNTPGTANTSSVKSGTNAFQLAARNNVGAVLAGMVDAIGVWSRVLTTGEIDELYNSGAGLEIEDTPTNDVKGLTLRWRRRDYRADDEVESVTTEASDIDASFPTANTTEYRASLYIDPEGDNDLVETTDWDDEPRAFFSRTLAIAVAGGSLPTRGNIVVETRHTHEEEVFEALQSLEHRFDISFSELSDDHNYGILDDGSSSGTWTVPDTGSYVFRVGQNFAGGDLQAKINAGAFATVISDTHHVGLLTGVTAGDTITVKHTQTGANDTYTLLTIAPPSSTAGAFAVLRI